MNYDILGYYYYYYYYYYSRSMVGSQYYKVLVKKKYQEVDCVKKNSSQSPLVVSGKPRVTPTSI